MRVESNLLRMQRRFFNALREPIFDDSRSRSELPDRQGSVSTDFIACANDLITASTTMRPVERLELYHRQYWYRLLDSIAEDFPGLRRLLGDDNFWGLMEAYLEAEPPKSYTLRHLGADLPRFIDQNRERIPFAEHVKDLARLEYALCESFEAGECPAVPGEQIEQVKLRLQPHIRLLCLKTPADTILNRIERGQPLGEIEPPSDTPVRFIIVYRESFGLYKERLPKAAFEILTALNQTRSLALAMERVVAQGSLSRARDISRVSQWFREWIMRGWLCSIKEVQLSNNTERRIL